MHSVRPSSVPRAAGLPSGWLEPENVTPTSKKPPFSSLWLYMEIFFYNTLQRRCLVQSVLQPSRWMLQEACRLQTMQEGRESVSPLKLQAASSGDRHTNKLPPLLSYSTCQIRQCSKILVWFVETRAVL